jgi:hypothetical protein
MKLLFGVLERLVPAVLLASGVTLLMAGLLSYAPSATFGEESPAPTFVAGDPAFTPGSPPSPTSDGSPDATPFPPGGTPLPSPTDDPALSPVPSGPPKPAGSPTAPGTVGSPTPAVSPTEPGASTPRPSAPPSIGGARASRIVIPSLRIDLPVVPGDLEVRGNRNFYPLCDVAQYLMEFGQPGEVGTAYIYAHAQRGMFLPLLRASWRNNGKEMLGALVEVYTTDSKLHLYEIFRVKRHALDLKLALNLEPGEHRLVLQTSEGPEGTIPKLQVAARPIGVVPAKPADAMPDANPRACPPRR